MLELLDAGINVMTAVNIQHLETLNDAVNRSANTVIRETVPDNFLKRANEVVNVDLTVEELRIASAPGQDLRAGKGGAVARQLLPQRQSEHAARAGPAHHRRAGEQPRFRVSPHAGTGTGSDPGESMVCLSTRPGTERLLRVGSRIAGRLASNWYAVYVARPDDDKGHGDPEAFHRLEEYRAHGPRPGRASGHAHRP